MKNGKIESFTDLNVWKEGHKLVIMIYKITKHFPKEQLGQLAEQANIVDQILQGFIRKSKTFINHQSSIVNR